VELAIGARRGRDASHVAAVHRGDGGRAVSALCFVIMPYGEKPDADGTVVDFDRIYQELIHRAVESIDGLECHRADDLNKPGWIHEHMLRHIVDDAVAVVDTSTLNANVFYELGVRHTVKKGVTVLIHRQGTKWPFNIAGMSSIEYGTSGKALTQARKKLRDFIAAGLADPDNVDSLVHRAVPDLRVERGRARPITTFNTFEFPLASNHDVRVGLVTGDYENIRVADVWVNSENTEMQMDRYYGTSTSATIRYLGATKDPDTGRVIEDTIGQALAGKMAGQRQVDPGVVIATDPGALRAQGVKLLMHAASVIGQPREGYRPIERIERCVTRALTRLDTDLRSLGLTSIMFPLFGTGPGGGDLRDHATRLIHAAVEYLDTNSGTALRTVYFYVWSDVGLEICRQVMASHPRLQPGGRAA
jgi:O-acetyl-ADP-ribose deacetylase (regulator of RNase III)